MKVCAIVPAFNEEKTVAEVVKKTLHYVDECVVVNDGSSDNTAKIVNKVGGKVIVHKKNLGTGVATQTGLLYAAQCRYDIVVLLDADGQHDPKYIPKLLGKLNSHADMVIGSRYLSQRIHGTSFWRKVGTWLISCLISIKYQTKISDSTSGFRAMNRRTAAFLAKDYPTTFPEPETAITLIKQRFSIKEISVDMKPRRFGKSSIGAERALWLMFYITKRILTDQRQ